MVLCVCDILSRIRSRYTISFARQKIIKRRRFKLSISKVALPADSGSSVRSNIYEHSRPGTQDHELRSRRFACPFSPLRWGLSNLSPAEKLTLIYSRKNITQRRNISTESVRLHGLSAAHSLFLFLSSSYSVALCARRSDSRFLCGYAKRSGKIF